MWRKKRGRKGRRWKGEGKKGGRRERGRGVGRMEGGRKGGREGGREGGGRRVIMGPREEGSLSYSKLVCIDM